MVVRVKTGPLLASFLFLLLLAGCGGEKAKPLSFAGGTMGTSYHVTVKPGAHSLPADLQAGVERELEAINSAMSTYLESSEISRFNRQPVNRPFAASADFLAVSEQAMEIYRLSGGAFDPTVGALVDLWGFGPDDTGDRIPGDGEIAELLRQVGFQQVHIDAGSGYLLRLGDARLDYSAIAKGYAADQVSKYLNTQGLENHLVEIGGELRLSGHNAGGKPWRVAVETPVLRGGVQRVIPVTDKGVATSGDYRNYFEKDGKRYSHTIDPRTGKPITHNLASVTVIDESAARADGLATAFMVMGPDLTLELADAADIPVFLLVKSGGEFKERYSRAFNPYLESQP